MVRIHLRGGLLSLEFICHCNKDGMGWGVMWWIGWDGREWKAREYERTELIIVIIINVWFGVLGILGVSRVAFG